METVRRFVLDEPGLYLVGAIVAGSMFVVGLPLFQAASILFWWYVACTTILGLYMIWSSFVVAMISFIDRSAEPGWNWANRPSIQDMKEDDPAQARILAEMWDELDRTMWQSDLVRLLLVITIFVSLPLGAFFFRWAVTEVVVWWKLLLACALMAYGFVMYHRHNR